MAPPIPKMVLLTFVMAIMISMNVMGVVAKTWCVARSDASYEALQRGLDYACGAGADCRPIQPGGICFYPNTIQNHASYAFDSYYQRHGAASATCSFGGVATIAVTNPSFGRCVYPFSTRTAGGADTAITTTPTNNPNVTPVSAKMKERSMDNSKRAETVSYTA